MVLTIPVAMGILTVVLLTKLPAVRYLSSEMAATAGVAVTVLAYYLHDPLGLQWLENVIGLR